MFFIRLKNAKNYLGFRNYLRRSRHLESEGRTPCSTSLLSASPGNTREELQSNDPTSNYAITPRDILSFAWQISKGMAYLTDIKVRIERAYENLIHDFPPSRGFAKLWFSLMKKPEQSKSFGVTKIFRGINETAASHELVYWFIFSWSIETWQPGTSFWPLGKFARFLISDWHVTFTKTMLISSEAKAEVIRRFSLLRDENN